MSQRGQVRVRTPQAERADRRADRAVRRRSSTAADGVLLVTGVDAPAVGRAALAAGVELHELTAERPDLEQVFLRADGRKGGHPMRPGPMPSCSRSVPPRTWWIFGLHPAAAVARSAVAVQLVADRRAGQRPTIGDGAGRARPSRSSAVQAVDSLAANLYTTGQFFGAADRDAARRDRGDQRVLPPDGDHHVPHHAAPHGGDPGQAGRRGRARACCSGWSPPRST